MGGPSETVHLVKFSVEKALHELVELLIDAPLIGSQASSRQQGRQDWADSIFIGSVIGEPQDFCDRQFANLEFRLIERREFRHGHMDWVIGLTKLQGLPGLVIIVEVLAIFEIAEDDIVHMMA